MKAGDIIRNKGSGETYVVTHELWDGTHLAVASLHICNPPEWEVLEDPATSQAKLLSAPSVMARINDENFGRQFACIRRSRDDEKILELIFTDGTVIRIKHNDCEVVT